MAREDSSHVGIFLDFPFSYKHDEWISASLCMLSCVLGHKWPYTTLVHQESTYFYFLILHFRYSRMSDHSLPEQTPTTLEPTEMDGTDSNCRSLSVLVEYTGTCRSRDIPKYVCVLGVVRGKGKEHYRNTERQWD